MKAFITGINGQLGRELSRQLTEKGIDYSGYDMPDLDITDPQSTAALIHSAQPDIIINCAAMTNVDGCETQKEAAFAVNGNGPGILAAIASDMDIPIIHISTDYVFDGNGIMENGSIRPYIENDPIGPATVYGESKAMGEAKVMAETDKYFIIRTAWLYGDGHNFVKTMLKLAATHDCITVVNDQIGSPTGTTDLATAIIALMDTDHYGIYHGTCEGQCSWYDFAKRIFELSDITIQVDPISSEDYPSKTPRPKYSVLENKGLKELGINVFRNWETCLIEYLNQLKQKEI